MMITRSRKGLTDLATKQSHERKACPLPSPKHHAGRISEVAQYKDEVKSHTMNTEVRAVSSTTRIKPAAVLSESLDSVLSKNFCQLALGERNRSERRTGKVNRKVDITAIHPPYSTRRGHSLCLEDIVGFIKQKRTKNIIVMAGAGISTASGIPDFRTPGTGLYANLKKYNIPYPEAIFDIKFFTCDPRPFFLLAKELYPGKHKPNYVHYFVRMLHEKGLLLRMYTQNIDSLETIAGIPPEKLVEAHGTFSTASCHLCYTTYPAKEAKKEIMSGKIPRCKMCLGTVKPDVVFFGEELPERFFLHSKDFAKADLLIVMGTSLQIEPFGSIINTVRPTVPRLLLNKDHVGPFKREALKTTDVVELGDLIESVKKLVSMLGWHDELKKLMKN
ncbi:NAD-dependent protein deacetylase sirtuin-3 [Erpetoichthys calabaricus]|uniref:NAD-dependent protein deacetylase sirtuin-3 n=1 Tax=Erpetoichthys calabaricus TaxID=27687 RepID=UPI002234E9FB|nr:NAD-dependent protein deacetylase sirtuin-3 [Erpetoichthys calabaricus]XP_028671916.2 NAD-dependent protein deacetylase sirtuin-3 [Erpetoichthys calabaricus]